MSKWDWIVAAIGFCLLPMASYGDEELSLKLLKKNVAHKLAICSAYYGVVSEAPGLKTSVKEKYTQLSGDLIQRSAELSNRKVALACLELASKTMVRKMEGTWDNYSIILNKYHYDCKDFVEKPVEYMKKHPDQFSLTEGLDKFSPPKGLTEHRP